MNDIQIITEALVEFRNERDWEQFHNPKDLAIALNIEAGELLEAFIWKDANADKCGLNVMDIVLEKIKQNSEKYPVDKSKGNAKKYNEI